MRKPRFERWQRWELGAGSESRVLSLTTESGQVSVSSELGVLDSLPFCFPDLPKKIPGQLPLKQGVRLPGFGLEESRGQA